MIESIEIKNVATYSESGIVIDGLKKVNFIYGANGSGKTTLSNFLHDESISEFSSCSIAWKNNLSIKTLVYNKEFRERNFGKGKISGVFTIGEATKEDIKVIEKKVELLGNLKQDGFKLNESLNNQKNKKNDIAGNFTNFCWASIYKKYQNDFKESFMGSIGSKELFKNKLILEFNENTSDLKVIEELKNKGNTIFGQVPQTIDLISPITFSRLGEIESNTIWKKIIIGKADVDIAKLIQKLNLNDWVNQGRTFLEKTTVCPFCQNDTITDDFKDQLENYFDETYLNDLEILKSLGKEYESLTSNLLNYLNEIEANQKRLIDSKLHADKFVAYLKTLTSQISSNVIIIKNKINEPSRSFEINSIKEQFELIATLIKSANEEIKQHNKIIANFQDEKSKLIKQIWKFLIEEFRADIEKFMKDKEGFEKGEKAIDLQLQNKRKEYSILDKEIKELSKNVTSIQPAIDEINRLLKSYGFSNFMIVPASEEGFYKIEREDGTIAEKTLSEGEITFITFLYFLQQTKGGLSEETVHEERILVIDDPISSLDSNVLFIVSSLIKELIKQVKAGIGNCKQVILLTHNVYFHKEVSYEGVNRKAERSVFWILRKNAGVSSIYEYGEQNPILSSYELLWREIREWEKNSGITIQNTMRRILENYFSILGSKRDNLLLENFPSAEEKEICRSLLSWANEGSHTLPDDLFVEAPNETISKYLNVFKKIFLHSDNLGHYNMMMGITEDE